MRIGRVTRFVVNFMRFTTFVVIFYYICGASYTCGIFFFYIHGACYSIGKFRTLEKGDIFRLKYRKAEL